MTDQKEQLEEISALKTKLKEHEEELRQAKADLAKEWGKSKWENRKQRQGKGTRDYEKISSSQREKSKIKKELTSLYKQIYRQKQKINN